MESLFIQLDVKKKQKKKLLTLVTGFVVQGNLLHPLAFWECIFFFWQVK